LPNVRPQGPAGIAQDTERRDLQTRSERCENRMREINAELEQRLDDAGRRLGVPEELVAQLRARLPPPAERGNPLFTGA
jgi:tetrahydromethanopterin S-methyltransferase subunit G